GYEVTVAAQPVGPLQSCSVAGGSGTVGSGDVDSVDVACTTVTHTVGGTAYGVLGSGLVLRLNGGNELAVAADGAFAFAPALENGSHYAVSIASTPVGPEQD